MDTDVSRLIAREKHWESRAGIAALVGAVLALAGFVLLQMSLTGDTNFEGLREAHDSRSTLWLSGVATAIGYTLLMGPLLYLFRAAEGRSPRVKGQFLGFVVLGPLLLGITGLLLSAGTQEAANTYLDGEADSTLSPKEARAECREDEEPAGQLAACESKKREEDRASNAIEDSSIINLGKFMGFAGGLSLVVALFYTCLWSLRTGLLSRFWGSLGMAVGIAVLIGLTPFALLWFAYLGLLLLGRVPGGKPPAWAAGEAIPWPTAGEKAAAELEGSPSVDPVEVAGDPPDVGGRRKRKQRD